MSAKHGRHQGSPQPESAGSPNGTSRRTARERSAPSTDLPKLRKDPGSSGSRKQPRRPVVPLQGLRRSVAVVGRSPGTKEHMSETRIGWVGTGVMGLSMCGHLMAKGLPHDDLQPHEIASAEPARQGRDLGRHAWRCRRAVGHHLYDRRTAERRPRGVSAEGRNPRRDQERQRSSST